MVRARDRIITDEEVKWWNLANWHLWTDERFVSQGEG